MLLDSRHLSAPQLLPPNLIPLLVGQHPALILNPLLSVRRLPACNHHRLLVDQRAPIHNFHPLRPKPLQVPRPLTLAFPVHFFAIFEHSLRPPATFIAPTARSSDILKSVCLNPPCLISSWISAAVSPTDTPRPQNAEFKSCFTKFYKIPSAGFKCFSLPHCAKHNISQSTPFSFLIISW